MTSEPCVAIDGVCQTLFNAVPVESWRVVRKLPRAVRVHFAPESMTVQTMEGPVDAAAGDAILTGVRGERWPVERRRFDSRYEPASETSSGCNGLYIPISRIVRAACMPSAFEVFLGDGRGVLHGNRQDWLIDYGDGSLGVVDGDIFDATYEVL